MTKTLHDQIIEWHQKNGGHGNNGLAGHALRLLHEAVELCLASGAPTHRIRQAVEDELVKHWQRTSKDGFRLESSPGIIRDELADVTILATLFDFYSAGSIVEDVEAKLKILEERKWIVDDEGVLWRP